MKKDTYLNIYNIGIGGLIGYQINLILHNIDPIINIIMISINTIMLFNINRGRK